MDKVEPRVKLALPKGVKISNVELKTLHTIAAALQAKLKIEMVEA